MPEPIRSPKQYRSIAKARTNPYPRLQPQNHHRGLVEPISQQSSLLGTIKSFVTAPLSWLSPVDRSSYDNEYLQKRKDPFFERTDTPPKPKRVRRDSPDAADQRPVAYSKPMTPLWDMGNGVPPARLLEKERLLQDNNELYCTPSSPPAIHDHTSQSVEPLDSKLNNIHIRRSTTREHSLPPPSPFARGFSRVSMTPQPSGATFGPSPKRKQRDLTAPPIIPLTPLPPVPSFTRAPSVPLSSLFPKPRQMSEGPIMSLLSQSRQSLSPVRETSSMLVSSGTEIATSPSKAERTLSTLEAFRTPLPRLASQIYPEDRRPRKVHVPLPSKQSPGSEYKKKKQLSISPYPTETSGLRKLLQRKRQDNDSPATDGENQPEVNATGTNEHNSEEITPKKATDPVQNLESISVTLETSTRKSKVDSYFSLRAPPIRLRRTHVSAPQVNKPRNKFSLKDDGDEPAMSVEELKAYELKMQKPNLTFNRRMSETGIQTDVSANTSKSFTTSPPSSSLQPRSFNDLLSEISSSTTSKPAAVLPVDAKKANMLSSTESQKIEITSTENASRSLPFSLMPGTSVLPSSILPNDTIPLKPVASARSTSSDAQSVEHTTDASSIPSFFSSSKTEFTPPPLPINNIFTPPPVTLVDRPVELPTISVDRGSLFPKVQMGSEQPTPSETTNTNILSSHSMKSFEGALLGKNQTAPPSSTSFGDTETSAKIVPVTMDNLTGPLVHTNSAPPITTPENGSSKSIFAETTAKEPMTSVSLIKPAVVAPSSKVPSFTFGPPTTPSFGRSEFTLGKPTAEESSKAPINIFTFGSSIKEEKQVSTALSTSNSLALSVGSGNTDTTPTETDNQMDTTDRMEESPARVSEKKDFVSVASPFNIGNSSLTNSPFSFGNSTAKPSSSPFLFGSTSNNTTSNNISTATDGFSFGQSKSAPASGFGFNNTISNPGGSSFSFSSKPSESSTSHFGTNLITSTSAPIFTFPGGSNTPFGTSKPEIPIPAVSGGSAPSSPGLFPQQSATSSPSFSFNLPPASTTLTFTKPDVSNSPISSNQPFQFGASPSPGSQPGAMFTLGAAATPTRKVKGLPQRRRK
ncbi:hypothetical protein Clacol_006744 [Clathrus columnatus]|uniref:Uncharacterized protein n=1 Tax=Clathrus columnatus TaxID=1419009 RepID=A0AAV5AJ47_9AGAM|nr:hypothetical protein Clacol_006744 [Clathrus columnatus]